jgi:prenylcysteine oxidase/farnesylcysteine lyase
MRLFATCLLLSGSSLALQFTFKYPFFEFGAKSPDVTPTIAPPSEPQPDKIAIIGAGAGGSSAAFWISKAKERFGLDVEVDVFEREAYIGGSG